MPVANLAFAVLKVALLVAGACLGIALGIAVSWGLGTVLVVLAVTVPCVVVAVSRRRSG